MHRIATLALLAAACATAAIAQKGGKPQPSTPLTAEIGYTYISGKSVDLRLANEDATGAVTLHKVSGGTIPQFDLGPRAQQQIAFIERINNKGTLKLLTYEPTGTGSVTTTDITTIYNGPGSVGSLSFSNDGSKIAFFAVSDGTAGIIRVYEVASGSTTTLGTVGFANNIAWYHDDGDGLVYINMDEVTGIHRIYEMDLAGTSTLLLEEPNIEHVDTARTSKDLLVSYSRPGLNEIRVGRWSNGSYANERVVAGLLAHFNCNDTKFVYRGYDRRKRPTYKYHYTTNSSSTFSTDNNIHHTDWMPTC